MFPLNSHIPGGSFWVPLVYDWPRICLLNLSDCVMCRLQCSYYLAQINQYCPILCLSKFWFIHSLWRSQEGIFASRIQKRLFCATSAIAAVCFLCSGSSTGTQLYHWRIQVHLCLLTHICSKYFLSCSRWPIPAISLILDFEILVFSIPAGPNRKEMFSLTPRHR